jgi:hypothetical protein
MLGNLLTEEPIGTAPIGTMQALQAKAVHFQVNQKYRRFWSLQTVSEGEQEFQELRFCSECKANNFIIHDERGHPHCPECGSIYPLPRQPKTTSDERRLHDNYDFLKDIRFHEVEDPNEAGRTSRAEAKHQESPVRKSPLSPKRKGLHVRHKISKY